MKKLLITILLASLAAGFAAADGLDMHFGLGYNAQFFGDFADLNTDLEGDPSWMPYGISGYAGVGYGFGARNMVSIGAEASLAMAVQFNDGFSLQDINGVFIGNITAQGRGYLKFRPGKILTLTAFGGYAYDFYGGVLGTTDWTSFSFNSLRPVAGARVTVLFMYAQYDITFYKDPYPYRHNFGIGFAFVR